MNKIVALIINFSIITANRLLNNELYLNRFPIASVIFINAFIIFMISEIIKSQL